MSDFVHLKMSKEMSQLYIYIYIYVTSVLGFAPGIAVFKCKT